MRSLVVKPLLWFFAVYVFGLQPLLYILGKVQLMPQLPLSIFCLVPVTVAGLTAHRKFRQGDLLVALFYSYILLYALLNGADLAADIGWFSALRYILFGSFYPFVLFLIFRQLALWMLLLAHRKIVVGLWLLFSGAYFALAWWGTALAGYGGLLSVSLRHLGTYLLASGAEQYDVGYQAIGDSYVLLSLLVLSLCHSRLVKSFTSFMAVYVLYIVGSRASLLFFILAGVLVSIAGRSIRKSEIALVLVLITFGCGAVFVHEVGGQVAVLDDNPVFRLMLGVVVNPEQDESYTLRQAYAARNAAVIAESRLLGNYRFEIKAGQPGTYTHNVVAVLEEYGLVGFVILLAAYAGGLLQAWRQYRLYGGPLAKYALSVMLFYGVNMFLARSYDSITDYFGIVFGIVSAAACGLGATRSTVQTTMPEGRAL